MSEITNFNIANFVMNNAKKRPNAIALFFHGKIYSYAELWSAASPIANYLKTITGDIVALYGDKSDLIVISMLACAISGKAFMPLNTNSPRHYNDALINHVNPSCILVSAATNVALTASNNCPLIEIETLITPWQASFLTMPVSLDTYAAILFTSGSTGQPKAVAITHANIQAYINNILQAYDISCQDKFLQITELNFDPMLHDIFVAWAAGASVYLFPEHLMLGLSRFMQKHAITIWTSATSTAKLMMQLCKPKSDSLTTLRYTFLGGEVLSYQLCHLWHAIAPYSNIVNIYGPTETVVGVLTHELRAQEISASPRFGSCPIGKPFSNVDILLHSIPGLTDIKQGIGECWISGPQVAARYLNDEQATNKNFIIDSGKKWYKTGDLFKKKSEEEYQFLGRFDSQIKIRGYRVSLIEVEELIKKVANTPHVGVIATSIADSQDDHILVAFVHNEIGFDYTQLKEGLQASLPYYMVPTKIIFVKSFPYTLNGKLDRRRLEEQYLSSRKDAKHAC